MGLMTKLKQAALGVGARAVLNKRFARYGTMPELHINLTEQHVTGQVILKGEASPIDFAADYELGADAGATGKSGPVVVLSNVRLSRAWMQQLAEELVVGKPLAVPPEVGVWLKRLGVM